MLIQATTDNTISPRVPWIFTHARGWKQSALSSTYALRHGRIPTMNRLHPGEARLALHITRRNTHVYVQNSLQPCTVPKYVQQQWILVCGMGGGGGIAVSPTFAHRKMKSLIYLLHGAESLRS